MNKPTFKHICLMHMQQLTNFPYIEKDFDALTDYGLLCKVVDYLNQVITNGNAQNETITALYNAFVELKDYVDNYFDNLDVQEEINNKLDEMAESGELTNLIKNYVDPIYENYENIINQEVANQDSRIRNVENQIKGVSSIPPIPVDNVSYMTDPNKFYLLTTNGYIYYNNGNNWVQGWPYQSNIIGDNTIDFKMLKNNILKGQDMDYLLTNYNINTIKDIKNSFLGLFGQGDVADYGLKRLSNYNYLSFTKNPVFKLTKKAINKRINYFINIYRQIEKASNSLDFTNLSLEIGGIGGSGNTNTNKYNIRTSDFLIVETDTLIEPDVNQYFTYVYKYNLDGTYIDRTDLDDETPNYTMTNEYKYKIVFKPIPNVSGVLDLTNDLSYYINSIKNSILTELVTQGFSGWYNKNFSITNENGYLYKVCLRINNGSESFDSTDVVSDYMLISDDLTTPLQNKKISILGDSFSAYTGIIPSGNTPYYNGNNAGVTDYREMWWQRLINNNGATREVIQASSGSNVSFIRNQTLALSNENMCKELGNPDIIIILGGTNDFSHTPALLGEFNGSQDFPTSNLNFADAYALMLSRILTTYPNATIFCCSLPTFIRTNLNKAECERNTETDNSHKTIFDYSEKIRQIADIMNCQYIDLSDCGFNRENYYPTYCQDSSTNSTHPNAKGQEVIFKTIEKKVIDVMNNLK